MPNAPVDVSTIGTVTVVPDPGPRRFIRVKAWRLTAAAAHADQAAKPASASRVRRKTSSVASPVRKRSAVEQ
jgi:hypothetical protein